jgi:Fungal specific transcription factor domain
MDRRVVFSGRSYLINTPTQIGMAQRLELSTGLDREIPPQILGAAENYQRRRSFWTIYIIDRKLSISMGCPLTLRDEDIDVILPISITGDIPTLALRLHAKLATLTGDITSGMGSTVSISSCRGYHH